MPYSKRARSISTILRNGSRHEDPALSLELTLTVPGLRAEAVGQMLEAAGAHALRFEEAEGPAFYDEGLAGEPRYWPKTRLVAFFLSQAALDFAIHIVREESAHIGVRTVADEGWVNLTRLAWQPFAIVDDLWIYPNDREAAVGHCAIHLDPGLAFGTGTHPTTRLCLQWLYRSLKERDATKMTVLDFGCGSGILAIAALRLGAAHALAIDVDPLALESAQHNAARNGVRARMDVRFPPLATDERCDLVVANILAEPLIAHKATLMGALAPGGRVALSGILEDQAEGVRAAFPEWHLKLKTDEDWCLLEGGWE